MRAGFEQLSLRFNPFGAPFMHERGQLAVPSANVPALVEFLARPRRAVQIIGDAGRGKSTHLRALHLHFPNTPLTYLRPGNAVPDLPDAPVVFLDEAQRLPLRVRVRLFRRKASFVIATHHNHRFELLLAGVSIRTIYVRGLTAAALRKYVDTRMTWAGDGSGPLPQVPDALLLELQRAHGTDMRAIERALYHFIEDQRGEAG